MIGKKTGKLDREKVVPYNILQETYRKRTGNVQETYRKRTGKVQEKYRKRTGKGGLSCLNIPFYNH